MRNSSRVHDLYEMRHMLHELCRTKRFRFSSGSAVDSPNHRFTVSDQPPDNVQMKSDLKVLKQPLKFSYSLVLLFPLILSCFLLFSLVFSCSHGSLISHDHFLLFSCSLILLFSHSHDSLVFSCPLLFSLVFSCPLLFSQRIREQENKRKWACRNKRTMRIRE